MQTDIALAVFLYACAAAVLVSAFVLARALAALPPLAAVLGRLLLWLDARRRLEEHRLQAVANRQAADIEIFDPTHLDSPAERGYKGEEAVPVIPLEDRPGDAGPAGDWS